MTPRARLLALSLLAGVVAVSSALARSSDNPISVTSTLDDKTALPIAAVSLAAIGVKTPKGTTIHMLEQESEPTSVPIGQHTGLMAGDEAVFNRSLFTMQKKPAGQLNITCVATMGGPSFILVCTGVYTLTGGTLVGTTVARPSQGPGTLHIAVTGGTGRYEGARGSILSVGSNTGFANDTIHLLP